MIVEPFGGMGGWAEGLRMLGHEDIGIEIDPTACRTRAAAGHATICADVVSFPLDRLHGRVEGLIMSPPCTDFSKAGQRAGVTGETGGFIYEVPRWVDALRPRWIVCEQVPPVLAWWCEFAREFEALGYSGWAGILNSADYGVAQTRERAILLASRDRRAGPPLPTHTRTPMPTLIGDELEPWVSMEAALGWTGEVQYQRGAGMIERYGARPARPARLPAPTLTASALGGGAGAKMRVITGGVTSERYSPRLTSEPAPTITGAGNTYVGSEEAFASNDVSLARRITNQEALVLQSFRADYPVRGNKGQQAQQIGNAVPPLLARAVLAQVI